MHFKIKKDLELGLGLDLGSFLRVETLHALWVGGTASTSMQRSSENISWFGLFCYLADLRND